MLVQRALQCFSVLDTFTYNHYDEHNGAEKFCIYEFVLSNTFFKFK